MVARKQEIRLNVNGEEHVSFVRPADPLLSVLRTKLGLTGSKPGCENGDCGACTVLVDGEPYKSCIMLGVEASGRDVTTVEGLDDAPIQAAFVDCFAFQCGYCTPGFLMNAHALLRHNHSPDDDVIREWLESNICRCTSYEEIERAVKMLCQ